MSSHLSRQINTLQLVQEVNESQLVEIGGANKIKFFHFRRNFLRLGHVYIRAQENTLHHFFITKKTSHAQAHFKQNAPKKYQEKIRE